MIKTEKTSPWKEIETSIAEMLSILQEIEPTQFTYCFTDYFAGTFKKYRMRLPQKHKRLVQNKVLPSVMTEEISIEAAKAFEKCIKEKIWIGSRDKKVFK